MCDDVREVTGGTVLWDALRAAAVRVCNAPVESDAARGGWTPGDDEVAVEFLRTLRLVCGEQRGHGGDGGRVCGVARCSGTYGSDVGVSALREGGQPLVECGVCGPRSLARESSRGGAGVCCEVGVDCERLELLRGCASVGLGRHCSRSEVRVGVLSQRSLEGGVGDGSGLVDQGTEYSGCGESVECAGVGAVGASGLGVGGSVVTPSRPLRGKHYDRNRKKRESAKEAKAKLYAFNACPSLTSVKTVDTRTAEEVEASRTYALRRAAENKVAEAQAKFKLEAYSDPDRVKAHKRLEAMRYSQRINEANAKSQASYKKCDESLKSLGSTGSAGELALKQQVRQAQEDARMLKYVQAQADYMAKHASPEVQQYVARMPPPKFESAHELFGDCPDDFDEDERADYYRQLDEVDAASAERFAQWF